MTIETEANKLLSDAFRLHDIDRLHLSDADFLDKLRAARAIVKAGRKMLRTAEARCNGIERWDAKAGMRLASWTDDDDAKAERSDERAEAAIREALAVLYGATWGERIELETQGDPRGAMVKVYLRGEREKGWPVLTA